MSKNAEQIWQAFMQSMKENTSTWQKLLADDFHFSCPAKPSQNKAEYIQTTLDFFQMVKDTQLLRYVSTDSAVAVEINFTVVTPSGGDLSFDVAEFYEVQNGKIKSVKIYYDTDAFRQAFATAQSPTTHAVHA